MINVEFIGNCLTVAELIAELEKVEDKTIPVITEGCDCSGAAHKVTVHPVQKLGLPSHVYIEREWR